MVQAAAAQSVDSLIEESFGPIAEFISSVVFFEIPVLGANLPLIVLWLVVIGTFFTFWLGFLNIRGMKHAIDLVRGKYDDPRAVGEVSHFQALATALSGTVGLGNIAGVAIAITIGGPGATFWMILAGFVGMSAKMAECLLGVKFRRVHADGTVSGGPMYYLRDGLAQIGFRRLGKVLAFGWALCVMIAAIGSNAFQSNQATQQLVNAFAADAWWEENKWLVGIIIALVAAAVIIGGIKSIVKVTGVMVPIMAILYVAGCLTVLVAHLSEIPQAFVQVFVGAFSPQEVVGGAVGAMIVGFQRAAYSNVAGVGDAAIAHSVVKTDRPATEGFVAALEPFVDTVIVCTMTALVIVVTGVWNSPLVSEDVSGVALTSVAFESVVSWFPIVLTIAVVLFAFSTILSYSFYGMKGCGYLFHDSRRAEQAYKVVFLIFTVVGASIAMEPVVLFADSLLFVEAVFNGIGLFFLAGVIRREFFAYWREVKSFSPHLSRGRAALLGSESRWE